MWGLNSGRSEREIEYRYTLCAHIHNAVWTQRDTEAPNLKEVKSSFPG